MENSATEGNNLSNLDIVLQNRAYFFENSDSDESVEMFAESSSDTSSSDDTEVQLTKHVKCMSFMSTIDLYSEEDFRSHMRLQKTTATYLIDKMEAFVAPSNHNQSGRGLKKTTATKMMYMYLWYISNTVTYRQLGNLFGVTKSTAWHCVNTVVAWLIEIAPEFIKWPIGTEISTTCQKFLVRKKLPGVIGAIDCTHINISAPTKDKEGYFDRKRSYSIVLQAVVDADKKFIDVYCGEPGSLHDSRVLRRSPLYRKAEANTNYYFPNGTFLLADSAYPCRNWLVPTFKDYGNLTQQQKAFNHLHSSARIVVENAFSELKNRFRRNLKFMEHKNIPAVTNIVSSACVLHNICKIKEGNTEPQELARSDVSQEYLHQMHDEQSQNIRQQRQKRDILLHHLIQNKII